MATSGFIKLTDYDDKGPIFKRKHRVAVETITSYVQYEDREYKTDKLLGIYTEIRTLGGNLSVMETPEYIDELLRRCFIFIAEDKTIDQQNKEGIVDEGQNTGTDQTSVQK